jgi:adenylosuccinate lyase
VITRYTLPEMGNIWSLERQYETWLQVEIAVCQAWAELGIIPPSSLRNIEKSAAFDVDRIAEIEAEVHHDVIAFLTSVEERVGDDARYVHMGMTSSDVLDTSLALRLRESGALLIHELGRLIDAVKEQAWTYRYTEMVGRTHGIHAQPVTLGLKLAGWYAELQRDASRLEAAISEVSVGKISGAVGTYAHVDPRVEEIACRRLGLRAESVSTQVVPRDRHAAFLNVLALVGSSLERFAVEVRHLQRTEISEVLEPFGSKQKGSSAMPHKRNPILCERVSGMARLLRGYALSAMENVALWHERDISHSSVERVILPDATTILHYMLVTFGRVVEGLEVRENQIRKNLELTGGRIHSQGLMLALTNKGVTKDLAYRWVQAAAMDADRRELTFREAVENHPDISDLLDGSEIETLFHSESLMASVDRIFQRIGIDKNSECVD